MDWFLQGSGDEPVLLEWGRPNAVAWECKLRQNIHWPREQPTNPQILLLERIVERHVARALAQEGIACLRFDFTGLGGSDGEFGRAGFATDVADLVAAAEELLVRFAQPSLLVGHGPGGAAVPAGSQSMLPAMP